MAGTLFTSTELDSDGRQLLLDDSVLVVRHYSTESESWDKVGSASQSWFNENFLPNDPFDAAVVDTERWIIVDTPEISESTIDQSGGSLLLGIEEDEGTVSLSSEGKWRLTGDFEIRAYIDWASYHNEYRSISSTFFKVAADSNNACRVSFTFNGVDGYELRSEKSINRDLRFFDWLPNGSFTETDFSSANQYLYYKITRSGSTITTYVSDGQTDVQIGDALDESVFSQDLYVELGIESKEFNTYRSSFSKFFVVVGSITPIKEFFSSSRGRRQSFPDSVILAVDQQSLSIIDEDNSKLWMRVLFDSDGPIPDSNTKVRGCNGTIYCTTSDGLVAFDFHRDRIYKYKDNGILLADENIALRNAGMNFESFIDNVGSIPDNNIHDVACSVVGSEEYVSFTHDSGITVMRALASGVANCSDGSLPGDLVEISEKGALFWSGYDSDNNSGQLSFFSNITALTSAGTNSFNRTGFYDSQTNPGIFGNQISTFDVRTTNNTDLIAVGTDEGITFISFIPGGQFTGSVSYGVASPANNPFGDPSFESYLGLDWVPFVTGFHRLFDLRLVGSFTGEGSKSLYMQFEYSGVFAKHQAGSTMGVYQDVDLTGVSQVYFDSQMNGTSGGNASTNLWDFEVLIGDQVVKSYRDIDGPFTKRNDSFSTEGFEGIQRVIFRIRIIQDTDATGIEQRAIFIDNLNTEIGDPDFRIIPAGNASVQEVLLQYDSGGHKIYFSTTDGYGAIDLDDNSLDYFFPISNFIQGPAQNISADFSRVEEDV